ncbi:MAG: hypothetical protein JSR97_00365 [Verrucomicrobia bacterium]|nr:hypothetical protein [Verrucomicrobiota bacterium]
MEQRTVKGQGLKIMIWRELECKRFLLIFIISRRIKETIGRPLIKGPGKRRGPKDGERTGIKRLEKGREIKTRKRTIKGYGLKDHEEMGMAVQVIATDLAWLGRNKRNNRQAINKKWSQSTGEGPR